MKLIKNSFTKNLIWKFLSLFFAIILWLIAVGIEDPLIVKSYSIPIEVKNINKLSKYNKVILNKEDIIKGKANIKITGRRNDFTRIISSNIKAYIDLDSLDFNNIEKLNNDIELPIKVDMNTMFSSSKLDISIKPLTIKLCIDNLINKEFEIKANKVKDVEKPFISSEVEIDPKFIKVSGAESILNKIKSVNVNLNLYGMKNDFTSILLPSVHDNSNNDITSHVTLDKSSINVKVGINKCEKIPILKPETIGELELGYKLIDIVYNPKYIEVVGKNKDIELLDCIKLNNIDISGISSEKIERYSIKNLLKGTNLIPLSNKQEDIVVHIIVDKESSKNLSIPIENFEIIGENKNIDLPKFVDVIIEGKESSIKSINDKDIKGTINIENANLEKSTAEISLILPEGVHLLKEYSTIKISLNKLHNSKEIVNETENLENNNISED